VSQIDLPKAQQSGLVHSLSILKRIKGIKIIELDGSDVVRHKLVKKIIDAYDKTVQESHPSKKVLKKNEDDQ
jgi:phosphate starvation-inducible PhoH-like protein